jgi:SAM-dependent methyltransferase
MEWYGPETYGDAAAETYDAFNEKLRRLNTDEAVAALAEVADGGPALELGIGTGRVALPLREKGVEVHGIDASEAMVERLRAKPGGDEIPVSIGDFAEVPVEGRFKLIFVVFNTFFLLGTQEDQVRCFRNVAEHLADDGVFLIEAWVPNPSRYERGRQRVGIWNVDADSVDVEVTNYSLVDQTLTSQHVHIDREGIRLNPTYGREVWPGEFNLMAELAGLRLRERWENWKREPFNDRSESHISLYERA